jgi:hypothetical protein
VPVTYAALAVLYLVGNGHAYYLASLNRLLLGLGAPATARWTLHGTRRTALLSAAVALNAAVSAVIALPLLPERSLQGSVVMALNPVQGETVGWPRFVQTITTAWRSIPAGERAHTAIFTSNYGEAGAIDQLGPARLPRVYSGHNGFSEWGQPPASDDRALLEGYEDAAEAKPYFTQCRTLARVNDGVGLDNQEQGLPVMLCHVAGSWSALWPHLRHTTTESSNEFDMHWSQPDSMRTTARGCLAVGCRLTKRDRGPSRRRRAARRALSGRRGAVAVMLRPTLIRIYETNDETR